MLFAKISTRCYTWNKGELLCGGGRELERHFVCQQDWAMSTALNDHVGNSPLTTSYILLRAVENSKRDDVLWFNFREHCNSMWMTCLTVFFRHCVRMSDLQYPSSSCLTSSMNKRANWISLTQKFCILGKITGIEKKTVHYFYNIASAWALWFLSLHVSEFNDVL